MGFFLTAGFLGMMYYFVPKQAETSVYSTACPSSALGADRVCTSGPARTTCTTPRLPDWAQSLGMVMSLILLAPSWGRHDQRHG
ncbi:hypothetical protein ACPA9J_07065 [Pseudomonas aeruginosa]